MGFMIQVLFEPSVLGVNYAWCSSCGSVLNVNTENRKGSVLWKTDGNPHSTFDSCGNEVEESPHVPVCRKCGEGVVGHMSYDGIKFTMQGELAMYPRHSMNKWIDVKEYKTKKGHMSTRKPLSDYEHNRQLAVYNRISEVTRISYSLVELWKAGIRRIIPLGRQFGNKLMSYSLVSAISKRDAGLWLIHERSPWHGHRKLGKRPSYRYLADAVMDGGCAVKLHWIRRKRAEWIDLKEAEAIMEENGFPLNRGKVVLSGGYVDDPAAKDWWLFDPDSNTYKKIRDGKEGEAFFVRYDEAQGSDEDEDWVTDAASGASVEEPMALETSTEEEEEVECDVDSEQESQSVQVEDKLWSADTISYYADRFGKSYVINSIRNYILINEDDESKKNEIDVARDMLDRLNS